MRMGRHVGRGPRGARCWHMMVVGRVQHSHAYDSGLWAYRDL